MKTSNHISTKTLYLLGFALLATLGSLSIPPATAHALSCLNPTEMIDEYVTDERFDIALVVAGALETEGSEHEQTVSVQEHLKGTTNSPVSFTYDETWQYLCAGGPAASDTQTVYVTSKGNVVQVINLDTPLYDALMATLENAPETPTYTAEEENRRTLMMQIIELLQQVIGLMQGELQSPIIEPEPIADTDALIGMTQIEAEAYAAANEIKFRIGRIDDEFLALTMDYRPGRITAEIEDGVIVEYSVE